MNKSIILLIALALAFTSAATQLSTAGTLDAPSPGVGLTELRYPVNLEALRSEFRLTGLVTMAAPVVGIVSIEGRENPLTYHGERTQNLPHIHILGSVLGHPGSAANILIGEYGVYGRAEIRRDGQAPLVIDFDAVETSRGDYEQWVHIPGGELPGLSGAETQAATTTTTYRDTDGEMDTWYDFDYSDDVAVKRIVLTSTALSGAVTARLHVYARADFCGSTTGTPHQLIVNSGLSNSQTIGYNSCAKFLTGSFGWASFDILPSALVAGQTNSFTIRDTGSSWNDRDHHFAIDSDTDLGRSDARANGVDVAGELMWYLTIDANTSSSGSCVAPPASQAAKKPVGSTATSTPAATPPNPCLDPPNCSGGTAYSWVTYHAERGFVTAHANWRDRITTAAAKYQPMWSALCINLLVWPVELSTNVLTSSSCESNNVREQYSTWLSSTWATSPSYFNDDAYQLWTHRDLWGYGFTFNDGWCFGLAAADTVNIARTGAASNAASVVEGVEHYTDYYDPDEADERGIVSGHELAHTYGEENHPYYCKENPWYSASYDCSIMRNCKDPENRSFFFTSASKQEIMFRFHYVTSEDHRSSSDDQNDCP